MLRQQKTCLGGISDDNSVIIFSYLAIKMYVAGALQGASNDYPQHMPLRRAGEIYPGTRLCSLDNVQGPVVQS